MWLLSCIPLQLWVLLGLAFLVVTGLWVPFAASILRMIPLKIWVIIITIVLLLLGVWYQHDKWFHAGEQAATTKIENANKQSEDKADAGQTEVDKCYSAGGTWDRTNNYCVYANAPR